MNYVSLIFVRWILVNPVYFYYGPTSAGANLTSRVICHRQVLAEARPVYGSCLCTSMTEHPKGQLAQGKIDFG